MGATFYSQILRQFDWAALKQDCIHNAAENYCMLKEEGYTIGDDGVLDAIGADHLYGASFLGTVMSLVPSGKYWTAWASSNVTQAESDRDEAWMEALNSVADRHGGWIETGEGDPCDLFFAMTVIPSEFLDDLPNFLEEEEEDNG